MSRRIFWSLFAVALVAALAFRVVALGPSPARAGSGSNGEWSDAARSRWTVRPMHHDEANQAVRFGLLLETGEYRYDRNDHHGPTLYYLTLPSAWLRGQTTLAALDERTLRIVPALFGAGIVLLFAWFARGLGRGAVIASALLAAVSPALTYYSRFYIQESQLVFFALGFVIAIGRYAERPTLVSALCAGLFAGLAYATKETSLIVLGAAVVACAVARRLAAPNSATADGPAAPLNGLAACGSRGLKPRGARQPRALHLGLALALAFVVAALFYTSFFTNPAGFPESIKAYSIYVQRGVDPNAHAEPWYYYLHLLAWSSSGGLVFTESAVLALAAVGALCALSRLREGTSTARAAGAEAPAYTAADGAPITEHAAPSTEHPAPSTRHLAPSTKHLAPFWPLYICLYSLLTLAIFSAIRYKTPWNLLSFYVGVVLMAGYGAAAVVGSFRSRAVRLVLGAAFVAAAGQLAMQASRADFRYSSDPRNPYAYVHTSTDLLRLVARVDALAAVHVDKAKMLVKVVAGPYEQWPLPWYLRGMTRVGYWTTAAAARPFEDSPIVIASEPNAAAVEAALGDRYVVEFYGLRPGVLLTVYIERTLWERYLASVASAVRGEH